MNKLDNIGDFQPGDSSCPFEYINGGICDVDKCRNVLKKRILQLAEEYEDDDMSRRFPRTLSETKKQKACYDSKNGEDLPITNPALGL